MNTIKQRIEQHGTCSMHLTETDYQFIQVGYIVERVNEKIKGLNKI